MTSGRKVGGQCGCACNACLLGKELGWWCWGGSRKHEGTPQSCSSKGGAGHTAACRAAQHGAAAPVLPGNGQQSMHAAQAASSHLRPRHLPSLCPGAAGPATWQAIRLPLGRPPLPPRRPPALRRPPHRRPPAAAAAATAARCCYRHWGLGWGRARVNRCRQRRRLQWLPLPLQQTP